MNDQKSQPEVKATSTLKESGEEWTSSHKKHCSVTITDDKGKKQVFSIEGYLRKVGLSLPRMFRSGKQLVHYEELRWIFMHGKTKEESQQGIKDYCEKMWTIYNEELKKLYPPIVMPEPISTPPIKTTTLDVVIYKIAEKKFTTSIIQYPKFSSKHYTTIKSLKENVEDELKMMISELTCEQQEDWMFGAFELNFARETTEKQ